MFIKYKDAHGAEYYDHRGGKLASPKYKNLDHPIILAVIALLIRDGSSQGRTQRGKKGGTVEAVSPRDGASEDGRTTAAGS